MLERHPQIGFRMLDSLGIDPVADWILHHHERWDGTGYPDRMPGPEIPLGARIIFVVDAYDAMTSDRVYRGRLSQAEVGVPEPLVRIREVALGLGVAGVDLGQCLAQLQTPLEVLHRLARLLRDLADNQQAVVMITHEPRAAAYADRVVRLRDGTLVGDDDVVRRLAP